ncbi:Superfamily II DNA or RNA helicase [Geopseudomonas sagittaria]|uniref:Superfamily II DNA or RNA helicase n=1 Tax=Geopseudomonas sagittaria TaxID=1135990 RepID=A0A1I5YRP0_9GAMM|nr:DEAD/DEAH box helicase [Pseudomonas sagittaria]SFQ46715.1 Superfamily II DNA or RNA helicase [Pseudomonas sagittaria]
MSYQEFVTRKLETVAPAGLSEPFTMPESLFPMQRDLVSWALRRGRSAIFADTGLGKTRMEVAFADELCRRTGGDVMILAPLAVAAQTVAEAAKMGITITHCREPEDVQPGINITNYDRVHKFDLSRFIGAVLDESSCIKHHTSRTFDQLVQACALIPYRLCATATPAPNDWTELGTHAEFLGVCTRAEMLAEFFVHDGGETQTWRLKGHARHLFWRWVSQWGAMVRKPSDLGYDDSAYRLPPLLETEHMVDVDDSALTEDGMLFALEASSLMERRAARKESMDARVQACADLVNADGEFWIIWGEYNAETEALAKMIPGAVEIAGSDKTEDKERKLADFAAGTTRVLVSKASICGWGLNWQHCSRMAFVGVSDSFEAYYQAVRRCYRFGQTREVHVHLFSSQMEGAVLANLRRKQHDAIAMGESLAAETSAAVRQSITGTARQTNEYNAKRQVKAPAWLRSDAA